MKQTFRLFSLVFTILFLWAGVLQWNDPDSFVWYFVYGIAAAASVIFLLGRLSQTLAFLLSLAYLLGTVFAWPEKFEGFTIGEGDIVNIEKGREACGLLIVAAVMLVYALRIRYSGKSKL
jgi:hypothetical protein